MEEYERMARENELRPIATDDVRIEHHKPVSFQDQRHRPIDWPEREPFRSRRAEAP
jgi:hypothetical protein